jgi:putative cardiolipin synthase
MRQPANIFKFLLVMLLSLLSACASTDFDVVQESSFAIPASDHTTLGKIKTERGRSYSSGESAFYPLIGGGDSLGARLRLIDAAEESIDLQYFLMKDDIVGSLISSKLLEAADRGVRVRFLLDDVFTSIKDVDLFVLNEHENIEVRLFNPIARRGFKYLNYVWNFSSVNRRMHNKSFTVDGSFTIVGGRNLATEYFSLNDNTEFFDFDMLARGPIAGKVAASFDYFWNFSKALGIEHLRAKPSPSQLQNARQTIDSALSSEEAAIYREAIESEILLQLLNREVSVFVAESELITELPEKLELSVDDDSLSLIKVLGEFMKDAKSEIVMVTPYFVPTTKGMDFFQTILEKGVRVRLVTNSLASTNHVPVHAAYERYRKGMLAMGAEIYETRADAFPARVNGKKQQQSTLHTKLIVIDRRYVFVGSLNLDPRSVVINTEIGIMIDSPELAAALMERLEDGLESKVYRLELDADRNLLWHGHYNGAAVELTRDPQASWWRHFSVNIFKILPEGQL